MALARSKISNRMVAQRLGVDETTIRRWRKENIEFERAFTEAREALREKINRVAGRAWTFVNGRLSPHRRMV
ncbi:hypothetical protein FOB46_00520 [Citrobacter braakii]|nr:hypothetical protein [Citrobacter braakii]